MADQNDTVAPLQEAPGIQDISPSSSPTDRRTSAEWDASKVPPSQFQKRKGSIYAVPASRDGHVQANYATKFHAKHAEKGYAAAAGAAAGAPEGRRNSASK